jgi:hypothetical protein
MTEPQVEREGYFVRPGGGDYDLARCVLLSSGISLGFEETALGGAHGDPGAWRSALDDLRRQGYVELGEAVRSGVIGKDRADELLA